MLVMRWSQTCSNHYKYNTYFDLPFNNFQPALCPASDHTCLTTNECLASDDWYGVFTNENNINCHLKCTRTWSWHFIVDVFPYSTDTHLTGYSVSVGGMLSGQHDQALTKCAFFFFFFHIPGTWCSYFTPWSPF